MAGGPSLFFWGEGTGVSSGSPTGRDVAQVGSHQPPWGIPKQGSIRCGLLAPRDEVRSHPAQLRPASVPMPAPGPLLLSGHL